jgi:autotransporter translocation and assembly factor TamB
MEMFWRITRRILFLSATIFFAANTIAYLVLNNQFVHEWFRNQANMHLAKFGLEISTGEAALNILESQLKVSSVNLRDVSSSGKPEVFAVEKIIIGYDPWKLNENWVPSLRFISFEDWKAELSVVKKFKARTEKQEGPALTVPEILRFAKTFLGQQIELKNGHVTFDDDGRRRADVNVKSLFVKVGQDDSRTGLTLLSDFGRSMVCMSADEPCSRALLLEGAELNAEMSQSGVTRIERLGMRGGYGDWQASGQIGFGPDFKVLNYNLKVDGSADATPWFHLAGMQGTGNFKTSVYLNPASAVNSGAQSKDDLQPQIHGRVSWSSLMLSGYDIYSGSTDIQYGDSKIIYKNAEIKTPSGALIDSNGEFSLTGTMPYLNTARIRNLPFTELMAGITVPTDVIHFQMDTKELLVGGEINAGEKKGFTLVISGLVEATDMKVPSFEPNSGRLPKCDVKLRIDSDAHHMSFVGSAASCANEGDSDETVISLNKGLLDYDQSRNDFGFFAQNAPASILSYFVGEKIEGEVSLRGSIFSSPRKPVIFKADVQFNDARVFGLDVPRVSGQVELDSKGMKVSNVEAWLATDEQRPSLLMRLLELGFSSQRIKAEGMFNGNLSDALRAAGERGRALADKVRGSLSISKFRMNGNLRDLQKSDFEIRTRIRNLVHPDFSAADVQAALFCQQGWCSGSRLFLSNLAAGADAQVLLLNNLSKSSKMSLSKAIFEIENISANSLAVRVDVQSVPIRLRADGADALTGVFDLRGSLQGGLKDWEISAAGRMDSLRVYGNPIGSLALSAASHSGGPLNIILSGLYEQVQARLILDHSFEKSTQLFASFRSFEVFKYLPQFQKGAAKISGEMTANLVMSGPGLNDISFSQLNALDDFTAQGQLEKVRLQVGKEAFKLNAPVDLKFRAGLLSVPQLSLQGPSGKFRTQVEYRPSTGQFSGSVDSTVDASIISQLTDVVNQSSGTIYAKGEFERDDEGLSFGGEAQVENVQLGGRYLSPPVTSINGRLVFQDTRLEIPSLTGAKGNGQVDVVGTVDFTADEQTGKLTPKMSLRANLRSAQFRWPQEFFETVETTLDGQIELTGQKAPYSLNGEIRIPKGRAYRDATCQEMIRSGGGRSDSSIAKPVLPFVLLNLSLEADNSFALQSNCIRGRVSSAIRISGTDVEPVLAGQVRLDNGVLNLLKTRFEVTRADAVFDNIVKVEPRVDAQMVARIEKYSVFVGAEGPLSKPRLNIWSDPSTGPDGNPLSRPALIRMISTGRGPSETTQTAVTQALFNQVVGMFDDPLSQAVSKITRGFVDRFELQPIIDGGQSSLRARASRDLGEKFNLGLDYETKKQSLTGTIFVNESVNFVGGFDRRSSPVGSYLEFSGGFRFQFGGK